MASSRKFMACSIFFQRILVNTMVLICSLGRLEAIESIKTPLSDLDSATLRSLGVSQMDIDSIGKDDEIVVDRGEGESDVLKSKRKNKINNEWWRDPLAQFDDEEVVDMEMEEYSSITQEEELGRLSKSEEAMSRDDIVDEDKVLIPMEEEDEGTPPLRMNEAEIGKVLYSSPELGPVIKTEKLPKGAKEKLKMHSIVPKEETDGSSISSTWERSKNHSRISAPAIPALLLSVSLPRIRSFASKLSTTSALTSKTFISVLVLRFLFHGIGMSKKRNTEEIPNTDYDDMSSTEGFDESAKDTPIHPQQERQNQRVGNRFQQIKTPLSNFFSERKVKSKPSRKRLEEMVAIWEEKYGVAETEKEIACRELESIKIQLHTLNSTTRYLRSQLHDNEISKEEAIAKERDKFNEELIRTRDKMITILKRERELMKHEMLKVRAMIDREEVVEDKI